MMLFDTQKHYPQLEQ